MTSVHPPTSSMDPESADGLTVRRVDPADTRACHDAMQVLLAGGPDDPSGAIGAASATSHGVEAASPHPTHPTHASPVTGGSRSVAGFQRYLHDNHMTLENFWAGYRYGVLMTACLVVEAPGRTAMAFFSPMAGPQAAADLGVLLRCACEPLRRDARGLSLVQALADPAQPMHSEALRAGGFKPLAALRYMRRELPDARSLKRQHLAPPELKRFSIETYSQAEHGRFAQAVLASYEDTLDCPGLLGLRQIDDVMQGHKSVGQFLPELWRVVLQGDEPIGVALVNLSPQVGAAEMVYLGLGASVRGKGLGRALLRSSMALATTVGAQRMLIAVDESNTPALKLYHDEGFRATSRKLAFIFPLER